MATIIQFNTPCNTNKQVYHADATIINHPKYNRMDLSDTLLDIATPIQVINNITTEFISTLNDIMYWSQADTNIDRLEILSFITEIEKIKERYEKLL